jgi:TonB-linked SusC/RagA family outer membrane protein
MKNSILMLKLLKFSAGGILFQMLLLNLAIAAAIGTQKQKIESYSVADLRTLKSEPVKGMSEVYIEVGFDRTKLREVFSQIESKTNFHFVIYEDESYLNDTFSMKKERLTVAELLRRIAQNNGLEFQQINENIGIKRGGTNAVRGFDVLSPLLQQRTITGRVTSAEDGQGIPGVNVLVKGTAMGTITGMDGGYSVEVASDEAVLVFSMVGFVRQEVNVGSRTVIDVTLERDVTALEEVVVVGFGEQKKVNLTGSVSTIDAADIQNRPITDVSQAFSGKTTGLWVNQTSGLPGNDNAQIRVRGWGTLGNADALVLIDGVEGSLSDVVAQNIESISVLKDAASSAIYGSKAANGVILITTKMGRFNEGVNIDVSTYVGSQSLGMRYEWAHDSSADLMRLWNQALANQGASPLFPEQLINDFENGTDPYRYPNTDFYDYVFRNAPISETNLSISGGSDRSRYNFSANYLLQDGIMVNTSSRRYNLAYTMEQQVNSWLTVGGRFNAMRRDRESPGIRDVMYWFANGAYPWIAPYTRDGRFGGGQDIDPVTGKNLTNNRNPLIYTEQVKATSDYTFYKINAFADIKFTDFLKLKTNFVSQQSSTVNSQHTNIVRGFRDDGEEAALHGGHPRLNISRNNSTLNYYNWFNTLDFNKTIGDNHALSAIVGMQIESTVAKTTGASTADPPKSGLSEVSAGTAIQSATGSQTELRMLSYFGRLNYAFADKYLFEMNLRADASSRFKAGNRWGIFPGFSAGWRLDEEEFIKRLNVFTALKLRGSWGQLGNQNIGDYWPYLPVVTQSNSLSYNFGGQFSPGAAITALVDENISWETTTTMDFGIEAGLLDGRLTFNANYFTKTTDDILVQLPIPALMGNVSPPNENVGQMKNKGYELEARFVGKNYGARNRFGYSISANLTHVTNKVTKFREGAPDQRYLIREGYPYRAIYGYKAIGVYQTDQEAQEHMHSNGFIPEAGQLKLLDVNNDGRINSEDKMVLGNTIPTYMFGSDITFTYKGFDLSILVQGIADVDISTMNSWTRPFAVSGGKATKRWKNAWTPENPNTDIPAIRINDSWNNNADASFWVQNISYVKLRNIKLGYTFPQTMFPKMGLRELYVYANAQNYFTFINDEYEGFDPEAGNHGGTGSGQAGTTFDNRENPYPIPRIISVGVNVKF